MVPIVCYVQQVAAFAAINPDFIDGIRGPAGGRDTLLKGRSRVGNGYAFFQV